jgi:hypothetical protein
MLQYITSIQPPLKTLSLVLLLGAASSGWASDGKLLATPGIHTLEGASGGGLVPWASIASYAESDQIGLSAWHSQVSLDNFQLEVSGLALGFYNRLEVSYSQQDFYANGTAIHLPLEVLGAKLRLFGDMLYTASPQMSLGVQHKRLNNPSLAQLLQADNSQSGTDLYLAISKIHLAGCAGYNCLWNLSLRHTHANQLGFLGFGSRTQSQARLYPEISAALLINPRWALGLEYREKPDQLALREDPWQDLFIAYFPNKHLSLTLAAVSLGSIAGQASQNGLFLSLTGYL